MSESNSFPPAPATLVNRQPDERLPFFPYRYMAVDVGSNATKYRVWEVEEDGTVRQLAERRFPLQLGHGTFRTGLLDADGIEAAVEAFRQIKQDAANLSVHSIRAVATSAMREASNSLTLVRRLSREVGVNLEILPDAEEARLIAMGVLGSRPQLQEQYLLIDIGGGSTEVILASDPDIVSALSVRLGTVRLKEMFFTPERPSAEQLDLAETHIHDVLLKTLTLPPLGEDLQCLGSAGTITTLYDLSLARPGHEGQTEMTLDDLEELTEQFMQRDVTQLAQDYPLAAQRADILLPGALILRAILRQLGVRRLGAVRSGVGDGLLHVFLERVGLRRSRLFDHDRAFLLQALALGEHYQFNRHHAQQVSRLALTLFDQFQPVHGLGPVERRILKGAALLHEIGQFIGFSAHHKHSFYLIQHADLPGLSENERLIMALVARYHRKSFPKASHAGYDRLDKPARERVRRLAALLRIADALDREQQSLVSDLRVQVQGGKAQFFVSVHYRAAIEIWNARQKAALFEDVFRLAPEFIVVNI